MSFTLPFNITSFTSTWHNTPSPAIFPSRPALSATGRNVIITGGGTGIGAAVAIAFAQAGASSVCVIGRNREHLESSVAAVTAARLYEDVRVWFEVADLTKRGEVDAAFSNIYSKFGPLDILVSSTGALLRPSPLLTTPVSVFMTELTKNAASALNMMQAFMVLAGPQAMLINISSGLAHMAPMAGMSASASSKAANLKMMDYLAVENPALHVVSVHAGILHTAVRESEAPDDVTLPAHFAVWLASPEALFLKGKYVWVNWDVEELKERAEEIKGSRLLTCFLDGVPM